MATVTGVNHSSGMTATQVQRRLEQLEDHFASSSGGGMVGIADSAGNFTATDVEGALAELAGGIPEKDLIAASATDITIAGGVLTTTQSFHRINTEGGAVSDDIDTITGPVAGQLMFFILANPAHNVVFKHGTGNLHCAGGVDITLDLTNDCVTAFDNGSGISVAPFSLQARSTTQTTTVVSSATPAINTDITDIFTISALAVPITSMTTGLTGSPVNGQSLVIRILDNGTARAITWGASFASRSAFLPTTTVASQYLYVGFVWNATTTTWDCVAATRTVQTNTVASSATPAINTDTTDIFTITALAVAITSMTTSLTGSPVNGQALVIRILDNGAGPYAIAWGAKFASRGVSLPITTVTSKYLYVGLIWNSVTTTWDCIAASQEV